MIGGDRFRSRRAARTLRRTAPRGGRLDTAVHRRPRHREGIDEPDEQREPTDPTLAGNYGTYGGPEADEDVTELTRWLADVDDYADTNGSTGGSIPSPRRSPSRACTPTVTAVGTDTSVSWAMLPPRSRNASA